jgi:hypothetical protein
MDQKIRDALEELRYYQQKLKAKANRRADAIGNQRSKVTYGRALEYETLALGIGDAIKKIRQNIARFEKLEKLDRDEIEALKKLPQDKTAGRNILRPRLGR